MVGQRFLHLLSFPEHIWLDFFRTFFSQRTLLVDDVTLRAVPNNFIYEHGIDDARKKFDVLLEEDLKTNNPNILPSLVIEDLGTSFLGIAIDKLSNWQVDPLTTKERSDLLRTTYILHCAAKERHESRLLASIVATSTVVFYNQLLQNGLHKIEPVALGKAVPIKSDADEVYVDTPVQVTFQYQQTWRTIEDGPYANRYELFIRPLDLSAYIRTSMALIEPSISEYLLMSMNLQEPSATIYVNMSQDVIEPTVNENYVLTSQDVVNPLSEAAFVRTSMRVA